MSKIYQQILLASIFLLFTTMLSPSAQADVAPIADCLPGQVPGRDFCIEPRDPQTREKPMNLYDLLSYAILGGVVMAITVAALVVLVKIRKSNG